MKFRTSRTMRLQFAFVLGAALAVAAGNRDASGADLRKTLRVEFRVAESGFDPQAISDSYSFHVVNAIFDPPYTYDYFARPVRLVPNTAADLPQISDGGRTYTFRIKPGIYFADHAAFTGKKRELIAADYVFSIKRMFDPKVRSYWLYLFEHNLLGLDIALDAARKTGRFDYDAPIEGLQALDRYTLPHARADDVSAVCVMSNWRRAIRTAGWSSSCRLTTVPIRISAGERMSCCCSSTVK